MTIKSVAIIGAGIAGLVASLAFARKSISVTLIDKVEELQEVGAGLQLSPNATRILDALGVLKSLRPLWNEPERIQLVSGSTLRTIASVPAGAFAEERWGAPYGDLHRATLQKHLLTAVKAEPLVTMILGQKIETDADIEVAHGGKPDLIVGADGVWSRFRRFIPGARTPEFSGMVAWRFTIPERDVPDFIDRRNVTAYLGAKAHVVSYPLREAGFMNLVALATGDNPGETWQAECNPGKRADMTRQFSGWHKGLVQLLSYAPKATWWPLFGVADGRWTDGHRRVLIGDAAHAMTPFAAQGAAMAIEDAFELAGRVTEHDDLAVALARFERARQERVGKVRARGAFNKFAYHARGPVRLCRDMVLSLRKPEQLAADLDWLYGHRISD